ncbi:MAG: hypothetical protein KJ601_07245 [Nanoarchaeota archaeon]|nr:hypothetical protein [Nanoarchaeota archaeon]MBU1704485.1 hypothetical protein [Nanoarchaeota archaeon]
MAPVTLYDHQTLTVRGEPVRGEMIDPAMMYHCMHPAGTGNLRSVDPEDIHQAQLLAELMQNGQKDRRQTSTRTYI